MSSSAAPVISDPIADHEFQQRVRQDYPASYKFESGYVEHEMAHIGQMFAGGLCPVLNKGVLEFGCNVGATSIVLAHFGARVTAVDVSAACIELARLNAKRYDLKDRIPFDLLQAGEPLPFANSSFDVITCNSVLEYVRPELLASVQRELNRVLRPGGLLLVFGTSNRLSPREPHSGKWLVNYIPRSVDRLLRKSIERGVSPWNLRRGFGDGYENLLSGHRGTRQYLEVKRRMGLKGWRLRALRIAAPILAASPLSIGLLLPYATLLLRKAPDVHEAESKAFVEVA